MVTVTFAAFLVLSMAIALVDWRRGWLLAVLCGVLQDPVRKLTPGTPVYITMSIVIVYAMVLFAAQVELQRRAKEFGTRFSRLKVAGGAVFLFLILAAINGLATYGLQNWKAPALALFVYCAPLPAILLGYTWLQREEQLYTFFRFYAAVTCVTLVGTVCEYLNLKIPALGTVALSDNIRYLPGLQIRMLSGFYRAPDIMAWHAATLTMIGVVMTLRTRFARRAWPWMLVTGWGFLNCMISGRRKAVYMVLIFAIAFLLRYFRRLSSTQIVTFVLAGCTILLVVQRLSSTEETSVYTKGTSTTYGEVFQRLEGGLIETVRQFGVMGAGLGSATQGVYHVLDKSSGPVGWQEGGLGKLAIELGVPGLIAVALFGLALLRLMIRISGHRDVPHSSQFIRAVLWALVIANVIEFFASAQAYSDAVLTLLSAFFLGCLLATSVLDERVAEAEKAAQPAVEARPAYV
jgi:hypothetical protein